MKRNPCPFNAYDLIGAVNALRAQFGLPAFNIDGSLMASAQGHSDYQASIQTMTHYGPGGNTANERAQAAGYSGRVSENIAVFTLGFDGALSTIIFEYWADDLHMNTMVNPQYLDVGAGVSVGGGRVYITLDAGWPTGAYPLPTHANLDTGCPDHTWRLLQLSRSNRSLFPHPCRMAPSTISSGSANP